MTSSVLFVHIAGRTRLNGFRNVIPQLCALDLELVTRCGGLAPVFTCGQHVVQHVVDLNRLDPSSHLAISMHGIWRYINTSVPIEPTYHNPNTIALGAIMRSMGTSIVQIEADLM
jgi:hypothetical protein